MSNPLVPTPCDLTGANTLGLAARAGVCVALDDVAQLRELSRLARQYPPLLALGGGSNVVLPADVPGLVVKVALRGVRLTEDRPDALIIEVGAGEVWHDLVRVCVENGWDGLENLALIPGTAGAAPVQNIGAYGVELADRFDSLTAWHVPRGELIHLRKEDCRFAYRDSVFKRAAPGEWLITSVRLRLPKPWRPVLDYPDLQCDAALLASVPPTAKAIFDAVCRIRRAKLPDPAVIGNAGSFFKNPLLDAKARDALLAAFPGLVSYPQPDGRYKLAAGWLIDRCGWKGKTLGRAGVHDRQALVLVNQGGATAEDIMALARAIQQDVKSVFGVLLEPEPVVVG